MKNLKFKTTNLVLALLALFVFVSCNTDESPLGEPPVITKVSASIGDVETTQGYANNFYIVRGSGFSTVNKVYFNETDTYFNPTLVTDNVIIVRIDEDTPYENASNELRIVNDAGTAVYPFIVAPPAPTLKSFNPINASEGETVTIYGSFFLDPIVTVGDVEVATTSSSLTEIQFVMPADANHKYVSVETISGNSISTYATGTAIYDDVWYNGWDVESWNNQVYVTDDEAQQGLTYFKKDMGAWDNLQGNWSWDDQIAAYAGIRLAVKGDDTSTLKLVFNGNWDDVTAPKIDVTKEWKEYYFTWADLGGATYVQNISFQEFTGNGGVYYFDNFGFFLNE